MPPFRGRHEQIGGQRFIEVIHLPDCGSLSARALMPLGLVPADSPTVQPFHLVDGKANP
jgi:hypothetical protein